MTSIPSRVVAVLGLLALLAGAQTQGVVAADDPTPRPSFAPPARIVSLAPSVTETLFALGVGDRVVAVSDYCDYPPEMRCGITDGSGVCRDIPEACTTQYDPICGCDNNTYGNACEAASKGIAVSSKGACK